MKFFKFYILKLWELFVVCKKIIRNLKKFVRLKNVLGTKNFLFRTFNNYKYEYFFWNILKYIILDNTWYLEDFW